MIDALTMLGKVKEWRHSATTWQLQVSLAQLVEERVRTCLQRTDTSTGRVLQQTGDECDCLWRGARSEHLKWGLRGTRIGRERKNEISTTLLSVWNGDEVQEKNKRMTFVNSDMMNGAIAHLSVAWNKFGWGKINKIINKM